MKNARPQILLFVVSVVLSLTALAHADGASLTVVDPNGGEVLVAGQTYTIAYQSQGDISNVIIDYSVNDANDWTCIDPNAPNTGSYDWTTPRVTSSQCLVRVADANNPDVNDTSDATFIIYICPLLYDLDYNCIIDFFDVALLASEWLLDGTTFELFNYIITATGTEDVTTYPDQSFTWTVTTTATETWTEYDVNSLYVNCYGYHQYCYHYLYPTDSNYIIYDWRYSGASSLYGGSDNGTYIDTANNRLAIRAHSGGREEEWCCGGWLFGSCMGWCYDELPGYWRATYIIDARRTRTATITRIQTGGGVVNATEGDKFIANFSLDAPAPQHGGDVVIDSYAVETDNANVTATIVTDPTGQVYASTEYSEILTQPWSDTETGAAVILPIEGVKYITTSTLVAPNADTSWSVTDDNVLVDTWMAADELYAEIP